MSKRIQTSCRDCKRCTNSGAANATRAVGRAAANVYTLGAVELFSKKCKGCGHVMSLHNQEGQGVPVQQMQAPGYSGQPVGPHQLHGGQPPVWPAPGWYQTPGGPAWWDGQKWAAL